MKDLDQLLDGYRRFQRNNFARQTELYRDLAETGQSPRVMVIACCDSRADPAMIFDVAPGDIFVVRNVANLVPPYAPSENQHGTSAALEFAVKGLGISHILVLGHARCGGITASLAGADKGSFIGQWMAILDETRQSIDALATEEAQQEALEKAGIGQSILNLMSFPFIAERVNTGHLSLHGGYFDIATGVISLRDPESGNFSEVT